MASIARADGVQFVISAYRETVNIKRKSILKQKMRMLAEQHGQFMRVYRHATDEYEGVFSRDPGYLLGEAVKAYFPGKRNFIFCEEHAEGAQTIMVVVRDGNVLYDTKFSSASLQNELIPYIASGEKYHIIVSGDVPISTEDEVGKFWVPADSVEDFTVLKESVFRELVARPEYQLQPLMLALKVPELTHSPLMAIVITIFIFAIGGFGFWYINQPQAGALTQQKFIPKKVNMFDSYNSAMTTPDPELMLTETATAVESLFFTPHGWSLSSLNLVDGNYTVRLNRSGGGQLNELEVWAKERGLTIVFSTNAATLTFKSLIGKRELPEHIYDLRQVVDLLVDQLNSILPNQSVVIGRVEPHGRLQEQKLTLNISGASPEVLKIIGVELQSLPVALNSVDLTMRNGMLSGVIVISIWGT